VIRNKMQNGTPDDHGFFNQYNNITHEIYTCINVTNGHRFFTLNPQSIYHANNINNLTASNLNMIQNFQSKTMPLPRPSLPAGTMQLSKSHPFMLAIQRQNQYQVACALQQQRQQQRQQHQQQHYNRFQHVYNHQQYFQHPSPSMYLPPQGLNPLMTHYNLLQISSLSHNRSMMLQMNAYRTMNNININNHNVFPASSNNVSTKTDDGNDMAQHLKEIMHQTVQIHQKLNKVHNDVEDIKKTMKRGINVINQILEKSQNTAEMMKQLIEAGTSKLAVIEQLVDNIDTLKSCIRNMKFKSNESEKIDEIRKQSIQNIVKTVQQAAKEQDNLAKNTIHDLANLNYLSDIKNHKMQRQLNKGQYWTTGGCPRTFDNATINIKPSKIAIQNRDQICVPVALITHLNIINKNGQQIISNHVANQSIVRFRKFVVPQHDLRLYHPITINDGDKKQYFGIKEIYCHGVTIVDQNVDKIRGLHSLISQDNTENNAYMIIIRGGQSNYAHVALAYPFKFIETYNLVPNHLREQDMILFVSCDLALNSTMSQIARQIWLDSVEEDYWNSLWHSYLDDCYVAHVYRLCISDKKENILFHRPIKKNDIDNLIDDNNNNNNNNNHKDNNNNDYVNNKSEYKVGDFILVSFNDDTQLWPAQIQTIRFLDLQKLKDDVDDDEDVDQEKNNIINKSLSMFVEKPLCLYKVRYQQLVSGATHDLDLHDEDEWVLEQQCLPFKEDQFVEQGLRINLQYSVGTWQPKEQESNNSSSSFSSNASNDDSQINKRKRKIKDCTPTNQIKKRRLK